MRYGLAIVALVFLGSTAFAQNIAQPRRVGSAPQEKGGACDSSGFIEAAIKAEEIRKKHRLTVEQFLEYARDPATIVIDARSAGEYRHIHVKGSINLPYTAFSQQSLEKILPTKGTRVLIYCGNNLTHIPITAADAERLKSQMAATNVDLTFRKDEAAGLNIPTFITLYIYGYRNVWELDSIVNPEDSLLRFVGEHEGLDKN